MSRTHASADDHLPALPAERKLAGSAFWIMTRRVTVAAACVDLAFIALFLAVGSPLLAWLNVVSIAMYGAAYWSLGRRHNLLAVALIWLEVVGHAAIGSFLIGWDSGFHYYLLMFIPAIVVSGQVRVMVLALILLLTGYLGLHAGTQMIGVLQPISAAGLYAVHAFNVTIVFAMAAYTARFYYNTVRRAERKLVELATTDSLTGLSNRRNMLVLAQHILARGKRSGEPVSIILADVDHFKQINDRYGHEAGDQVIAHVGMQLAQLCRETDVSARWGGEEFLIMLPNTDVNAAQLVAERIRESARAFSAGYRDEGIGYTLSLGVTLVDSNEPLGDAIARADRALYQSKADGRDRVSVVRGMIAG